jgi:hypothetical protein
MLNAPNIVIPRHPTKDFELLRQLDTGDLNKTEQFYKENGILYKKPPGQQKKERFLAQVTNPNTGQFLQPETLKAVGAVPQNYENNKKYPIKTV